jgi:hypothetical protein
VVVLDIAFAADGIGRGFAKTTGKLIDELGPRLAKWVDHHDHPLHASFASDPRFVLCTKAEHGACPELITEEMVRDTGPIDTIVCHFDLDGLYSAAKWILGGKEPYPGADDDAHSVDTRIGEVGPEAARIDKALRAHSNDQVLRHRVVGYLVGGMRPGIELDAIEAAAADFDEMAARSRELAETFEVRDQIALLRLPAGSRGFDKTELLLLGQEKAPVAVVADAGNVTIAASYESGLDFVELLEIGGGMPTRVNIPEKLLADALARIRKALASPASPDRGSPISGG